MTDPYEEEDDSPTLQRPPTGSQGVTRSAAVAVFPEEPSTDTDLAPLDALGDAHTVDSLPAAEVVALMDLVDYEDMETPRIPLDLAAVLRRASQGNDAGGS